MYEPSKHIATFNIAGFQYYDGAQVIGRLKVGDVLGIVAEPDNPHDANAVAIGYGGLKLGYVPRNMNENLALMMFYGHADVYELRVLKVDDRADPWEQVMVGLYIRDAR